MRVVAVLLVSLCMAQVNQADDTRVSIRVPDMQHPCWAAAFLIQVGRTFRLPVGIEMDAGACLDPATVWSQTNAYTLQFARSKRQRRTDCRIVKPAVTAVMLSRQVPGFRYGAVVGLGGNVDATWTTLSHSCSSW
jgi:hypothetical protein